MRPAGPDGSPACLFQRKSFTSAPLLVQCSLPIVRTCSSICATPLPSLRLDVVGLDDLRPAVDLRLHEGAELVGFHRHRHRAELLPRDLDIGPADDLVDLA